jgi:uncharacterized RDD family membrane protein YckC
LRHDFAAVATDWTASSHPSAVLPGERVTFTRRFFGAILESLLFVVTLFLGWFIWLAIVAPKGQTPAKQLLGIFIHDYQTGEVASTAKVWQRDAFGKLGVPWIILLVAGLAGNAFGSYLPVFFVLLETAHSLSPVIILFTRDRRAIWDWHSGTVVRYHPRGISGTVAMTGRNVTSRLEELELLWRRGRVSKEEYDQKRREILSSL